MKAVIYHAEGIFNWHGDGIYLDLIKGLKENLKKFGIPLIHVTTTGHPGLGDENYFYDGDPNEVIYNREKFLIEFLKNDAKEDEVYWFCEPDFRMLEMIPPLTTDVCMTLRNDPVALTPAWRLAKKSGLAFFEESFKHFDLEQKKWHGDSIGWMQLYKNMGSPTTEGIYKHNGMTIELRPYGWYCARSSKARYTKQWKGGSKDQITSQEYKDAAAAREAAKKAAS
jgi:hypothetical protein